MSVDRQEKSSKLSGMSLRVMLFVLVTFATSLFALTAAAGIGAS